MSNSSGHSGQKHELHNGYDVAVYGLDNGSFYYIHIPAILCIVISFTCATIAILLSFKQRGYRTFFTQWSKSEKFVVYLAVCDGLFNVSHFTDHMHIAIAKDMVYPKELCAFYGFNLAVFITAQNLMVNVVAINAFMLIYFQKNLNFGARDWKLLTYTFVIPFLCAMLAGVTGQLGPNGAFCYFDAIKGRLTNIFFTTVPLVLVLVLNIILYVLTWVRIHNQTEALKHTSVHMSASMRASHRAARAMSMFVAAFFMQWWAMALYGLWGLIDEDIPQVLFHCVTTFSNIGGVLNLCVYLLIRRRQLGKGEHVSTEKKSFDSEARRTKREKKTNISLNDITASHDSSLCDSGFTQGSHI